MARSCDDYRNVLTYAMIQREIISLLCDDNLKCADLCDDSETDQGALMQLLLKLQVLAVIKNEMKAGNSVTWSWKFASSFKNKKVLVFFNPEGLCVSISRRKSLTLERCIVKPTFS